MENKFESQQYSFQNSFGNLRLVAPNMVGGFLQQNTVISIHKSYYVYNEKTGLWTKFEDEEVKKEIFELLSEEEKQAWTPTVKNNVMELLSVMTKRFNNIPEQKGNWFCLNNCVVNLDTGKAKKFSKDFFFTGKTTYDFVRGAKCPRFEEYLDTVSCGNESIKQTLVEVLGYSLSATTKAQVAFYLFGLGCNGKSIFTDIVNELVGMHFCVSFKPDELEKSFTRAGLEGKRVLLMPDLDKKDSEHFMTAEMKKIIAGDLLSAEIKYGGTFNFHSKVKVIVSSNFLPSFLHDNTFGARRRLLVIPFRKQISEDEKDTGLISELKGELSGIFLLALEGYKRLKANKFKFSYKGEDIIEEIKEGQKQTYPISSFVSECVETKPSSFVRYRVLGKAFAEWCKKNNVESSIPDSRELFANIKEQHSKVETKKRGGHRGVLGIALKNQ